jgi:hypothetical protein
MTRLSGEALELNFTEISRQELDKVVGGGAKVFDIEQVLNTSSQSKGAGVGKITFNPFR